jgi:hypothetical protein
MAFSCKGLVSTTSVSSVLLLLCSLALAQLLASSLQLLTSHQLTQVETNPHPLQ